MAIVDDLHTLLEALREAFEIVDRKPKYPDPNFIVEELAKLLDPIQFDN